MSTVQEVRRSTWYGVTVAVGLISYGVIHLLIAWIALQLAWGGSSTEASQQGALEQLSSQPLGGVLLWVVAIGLLALVGWRVLDLIYGHLNLEKKVSSIGRAAVYLFLGISAVRIAVGSSGSSTGKEKTMTARLMAHGYGRALVVAIGIAIIAIGVRQLHKAITKKFTEDLVGGVSSVTIALGRFGYAAKGLAFFVVGVLFGWAALKYDPQKAGGLDSALHTIKDQPFGGVLLTVLAAGFAAFALYAFAWARNARR